VDARIAPPFIEAADASRLVCVVVVSYQEYSLTHMPQGARVRRAGGADIFLLSRSDKKKIL